MEFLRILTMILDIAFMVTLIYFASPLRWEYQEDRTSIVGFGWMMVVLAMNMALLAVGRF